jgi:hypothetical protein
LHVIVVHYKCKLYLATWIIPQSKHMHSKDDIQVQTHGGHYRYFIKPCEKEYKVLLLQERKYLNKFWNYHSLDEMTLTILYQKYGR